LQGQPESLSVRFVVRQLAEVTQFEQLVSNVVWRLQPDHEPALDPGTASLRQGAISLSIYFRTRSPTRRVEVLSVASCAPTDAAKESCFANARSQNEVERFVGCIPQNVAIPTPLRNSASSTFYRR
jgi:hypothetical protein